MRPGGQLASVHSGSRPCITAQAVLLNEQLALIIMAQPNAKPKASKTPYEERPDDQRLESNWKKACGLYARNDHSAAVLRAATSAEIAANIYIRHFLMTDHNLPAKYVDALLISANGLDGKFRRLIKPAAEVRGTWRTLKSLQKRIDALHEHRNSVAHAGYFKNAADAEESFENSLEIIRVLAPNESQKLELPYVG